ncbi:hypothetical protein GGQ74_002904 [Desulfobaculum xiamenense]|uniref:Uncharacterized protein n=1 Tax=Desulfobaculum xiamenense TaxID=995050 RepID=A0A846QPU8_9BACT|nr:glycosyltransferase family 4 protein [Desulfobaculum xiamenense]NJB69207.1 hypothetical protein [Desulfobaculum xiamenense]
MTVLALAVDRNDACWLRSRFRAFGGDAVVAATTLAAQDALAGAGIPFRIFEAEAWDVDKQALSDAARRMAATWHLADALRGHPDMLTAATHRDIPLYPVLFHTVFLGMFEAMQAHVFMRRVLDTVRPRRVVMAEWGDPFASGLYGVLASEEGLEREALAGLCASRGIAVERVPFVPEDAAIEEDGVCPVRGVLPVLARKVATVRADPASVWRRFKRAFAGADRGRMTWESDGPPAGSPSVLVRTWAGHYLDQVLPVVTLLAGRGAAVTVAVEGGIPSRWQVRRLHRVGARLVRCASGLQVRAALRLHWERLGRAALRAVEEASAELFADGNGESFAGPAMAVMRHALVRGLPDAAADIECGRELLDRVRPDVELSHFAVAASGVGGVLPARVAGVPTLTIGHGLHVYTEAERDVFATRVCATAGTVHREAAMHALGCAAELLPTVGDCRLDMLAPSDGRARAVRRLGLSPAHPVCVACVTGPWTQAREARHADARTLRGVLALRREVPGVQLVYRMHHGADAAPFRGAVESLGDAGVIFQSAPNPPLPEVLRAADVVIAHQGSAIAEAVLCGVRVIYLCALAPEEPSSLDCPVIVPVRRLEDLPGAVRGMLATPMSRREVRERAQPWLERVLCGADGGAARRMADLVLALAARGDEPGFEDWLDRQRASAAFSSASWQKTFGTDAKT